MGTVFEAWQDSLRRRVALKVLDAGSIPSEERIARFQREAWLGGRLNHPNIVNVYGQGLYDDRYWIAMELVEGPSLHAFICEERSKAQTVSEASAERERVRWLIGLFLGVVEALAQIHASGIIHRDIKPLNLLLTRERDRMLLTDFGLARDEAASRMTRQGDFFGTVRYMSPEQLLAHRVPVDHRTDIWSLGVSLYEAVTLRLPFAGDSEQAYLAAVTSKEPAPARAGNRSVPRDLETILMKCLERDPDRRYASAATLRDDLVRFLEDRPVLAQRTGWFLRSRRFVKRHRRELIAAAAASVLITAGLGVGVQRTLAQRDRARLTETLEKTLEQPPIPNGRPVSPDEHPDWTRLERILQSEIGRNPASELSRLGQRAAIQVWAEIPPFGLATALNRVAFYHYLGFDPGQQFTSIATLEGSWDGGPWRSVLRSVRSWPGTTTAAGLEEFGADGEPGPHSLDLRASLAILRHSNQSDQRFEAREPETASNRWLVIPDSEIVFKEVRPLGSFSINLFDTYPSGFPRPVFASAETGPIQQRFRPRVIRLICVELTDIRTTEFTFDWQGKMDGWIESSLDSMPQALLAGIEIRGIWDPDDVLPIAASCSLGCLSGPAPILTFDLVLSRSDHRFSPGRERLPARLEGSRSYRGENDGAGETVMGYVRLLGWAPDVSDGDVSPGYLKLAPSHDLALRSGWLDRYFASEHTYLVDIETVRIRARERGQ